MKDHEDDPLGFQHKTAQSSLIFLSIEIPTCVVNLNKRDFNIVDTLLNELSEWEPQTFKDQGEAQSSEVFALCAESDSEGSDDETETLVSEKMLRVIPNGAKQHSLVASVDIATLSLILHQSPLITPETLDLNPSHSYHLLCEKYPPLSFYNITRSKKQKTKKIQHKQSPCF